jgi:hypothetical protein
MTWKFFLLVFPLSIPFALAGAATPRQLAPGIPMSALGFVCPIRPGEGRMSFTPSAASAWSRAERTG